MKKQIVFIWNQTKHEPYNELKEISRSFHRLDIYRELMFFIKFLKRIK